MFYSRVNWGDAQAHTYVERIRGTIARLAERPGIAMNFTHDGKTYFRKRSGSHAVFARIEGDRLIVVRILHVRMDYPRHLN